MMKIELSLPKLFYGNNFQELKGKDFNPFIQKLSSTLIKWGLLLPLMHYRRRLSQHPLLKEYCAHRWLNPISYINKIKEANIKLSLDTNQTDYRNEGHSYKWHCNSYEVVFYDKIKDLEKAKQSDKRAVEKDSAVQLNLFNQLQTKKEIGNIAHGGAPE